MILTVGCDGDTSRGLTTDAVASASRVVATDVVGCADAIEDGVTRLLVPPRDVGALVAALRRYVGDPTLRRQHGRAAHERIARMFRQREIREALARRIPTADARQRKSARPLIVYGAGGHGKVVADILIARGEKVTGFLDDTKTESMKVLGLPVLGSSEWLDVNPNVRVALGVGNNIVRARTAELCVAKQVELVTAIHPSAVIAQSAVVEEGAVIMALAVVNPDGVIGRGAIVNTSAVVEHDCAVGSLRIFRRARRSAVVVRLVRSHSSASTRRCCPARRSASIRSSAAAGSSPTTFHRTRLPSAYLRGPRDRRVRALTTDRGHASR